jgi:hypothetical protein
VAKATNSANNSAKPTLSDNATSSASVGLLLTHFYFLDPKKTGVPPTLTTTPLCDFPSG